MKRLFSAVVIAVIVVSIFAAAKNFIAKQIISAGVRTLTGLKVDMRSMDIGIFRTLISIDGLRLFNPSGFEGGLMVDMPEVYVDYDLDAFIKGKVHLKKLRLDLREFIVVKNSKGEVNLDSLETIRSKKPASGKNLKTHNLRIDVLELKIGKVLYKDYYNTAKPRIREFKVNIDERYENITDPGKLTNLIVLKALVNTSVSGLTGFDMGILMDGLGDTLGVASKIVGGTAGTAIKAGGGVVDSAKETTEKAAEAIKNILPLGK